MQGRAPRAQPTAPQARGTRARPPSPAKISAWGRPPEGGEPDEGKGGAPRGRGGGRGTTRREMNSPALPHATPDAAASSQTSARRQAAGAPMERKTAAGSPSRGRGTERGQRPSRPDGRRKGGQRAREPPHLHPTPQLGRDHASGRRRGGQGGRRRRRPGGTRARLLAATHATSAERLIEPHQQRGRRKRERRARGAGRGHGRRARNTPAQRSERRKAERTGNRASRRAQSGRARRRSGRDFAA